MRNRFSILAVSVFEILKFNFVKRVAILVATVALAGPLAVRGQNREAKDFAVATNQFYSGAPMAEESLGRFVATYTNSPLWTNALLLQARARIEKHDYVGALALLQPAPPGKLAPEYVFWAANAYYAEGKYSNAIERCDFLIKNYDAAPPMPLRTALLEAQAFTKLSNWTDVITLLSKTNGVFQVAANADPSGDDVVAGYFILGEAFFNRVQYAEARDVISKIATANLTRNLQWQREYLLCQILLKLGGTEEALVGYTNLYENLMTSPSQAVETSFLLGEILEKAGRPDEAIGAFFQNLGTNLPSSANPVQANRNAFREIIALKLQQSQASNTMQWLDDFIKERPNDPVLDLARYHLGDLELKAFFASPAPSTNLAPPPDTNLLSAATTNFDIVIHGFTNSEVLGQTYLDRGWCDWQNGDFAAATNDFSRAADILAHSEAQAAALFKLADAEYRRSDYRNAANHYNRVLQEYAAMESVTNRLFEPALYQLVHANLQLGDSDAAQTAADHLLHWFPDSSAGEQSYLLVGEDLSSRGTNYAEARAVFGRLLQTNPATPLWPEIQLAMARTYEQEGDWTNALDAYTALEDRTNFPTNLLPRLKFSLALACWKADQESNALVRMSNVVTQFPADNNAALAKYWIGSYLLDNGRAFDADVAFQELVNNFTNAGPLIWQARLMAGRAALKYHSIVGPSGASNDFRSLAFDTNTPPPFSYQAHFQFGNLLFQLYQDGQQTNKLLLPAAIDQVGAATNAGPTNILATAAAGRLGDFYLSLADLIKTNAEFYSKATNWYQMALTNANDTPDGVAIRNQAEFGLGLIAERQSLTNDALFHYGNILFDANADPSWVKNAGVRAAALYEAQNDWPGATNVYYRVQQMVPSLRDEMQRDINRLSAAGR